MVIGYVVHFSNYLSYCNAFVAIFKGLRVVQNRSFMVIVICVDSEVVVRSLSRGDVVRLEIDP